MLKCLNDSNALINCRRFVQGIRFSQYTEKSGEIWMIDHLHGVELILILPTMLKYSFWLCHIDYFSFDNIPRVIHIHESRIFAPRPLRSCFGWKNGFGTKKKTKIVFWKPLASLFWTFCSKSQSKCKQIVSSDEMFSDMIATTLLKSLYNQTIRFRFIQLSSNLQNVT